ncbi:MAG: aspartate aminotransferase family protein [Alphaproteobacteria bacterium]|nr:aspartate aminotransferase family protein [Alphaproteobacteria bacterium]|tara:strand:+ start:14343 stop:15740 length:1398 start_codon:yes stop_codon:yes gene_type:complete
MSLETARNISLEELDKQVLLHPVTSIAEHQANGPLIFNRAGGVRMYDNTGKSYIDGAAALWCVNVGYGRKRLSEVAKEEMDKIGFYHTFGAASNEPAILLADKLVQLLHDHAGCDHIGKIFFGLSGSDANDTQFKLARYYNNLRGKPNKKKIISRIGGYHGTSAAAGSLTGIPVYHKAFDLPFDGVLHTSCPNYWKFGEPNESEEEFTSRMLKDLEDLILKEGPDTIAGFIAEPIMGTGGVIVPTREYYHRVQSLLKKHDILFMVDEVINGFGRLGSWFGSGFYGIKPDLMSFAKGLTSAYFPMSAVGVADHIWQVLADGTPEVGMFAHGFTYSGHPVGAAVGLANIEIMEEENLIKNAAEVGAYLKQSLIERLGDHPNIGEIRGEGLMIGIEYAAEKGSKEAPNMSPPAHKQVAIAAQERGLLTRALPFLQVNNFSPPLTFTKSDADESIDIFAESVEKVFGKG